MAGCGKKAKANLFLGDMLLLLLLLLLRRFDSATP